MTTTMVRGGGGVPPVASELSSTQTEFLQVMRGLCAPVSIVTAFAGRRPHGTTVSSLASLSLSPPMIMFALAHESDLLELMSPDIPLGINILGHDQSDTAALFASKGRDRFASTPWRADAGAPRLEGAVGWLTARVTARIPTGDHMLILGAIEQAEAPGGHPLVYHHRAFGTFSHTPPTPAGDQLIGSPVDGPDV